MKKIFYFLICFLFISSCELERDNPLDLKNPNNNSNNNSNGSPSLAYTKFIVSSDDNNNGIIEKGEHIKLKVFIKNRGTGIAKTVNANFSFNSYTFIFFDGGTAYYGDISPSTESYGVLNTVDDYSMSFTVSYDIPSGTTCKVSMLITDTYGANWTDSFTFIVL
jgi:hypothetical protein